MTIAERLIAYRRALIAGSSTAGLCGLLLVVRVQEQTGDSLTYAWSAQVGRYLFHPHHLLFCGAVRTVWRALGAATGRWDVILAAQLHNLGLLALGMLAIYALGARALRAPALGLLGALWWAASHGVMAFATQVDAYVPAAACLAIATAALFCGLRPAASGALLAASWALAVCYHQMAVLFAVPLAVELFGRPAAARRPLVLGAGAAGAAVLAVYLAVYHLSAPPLRPAADRWLDFCLWYLHAGPAGWGTAAHFGTGGLGQLVAGQWWAWSAWPAGRLAAPLLIALIGVPAWRLVACRAAAGRRCALLRFASSWYLSTSLFVWWWLPEEHGFFVLTTLPLLLAVLAAVAAVWPAAGRRRAVLAASAFTAGAALLAANLVHGALPRHRQRGPAAAVAAQLAAADNGHCLVMARYVEEAAFRFYHAPDPVRSARLPQAFRQVAAGGAAAAGLDARRSSCLVIAADALAWLGWVDRPAAGAADPYLPFLRWLLSAAPCSDGSGVCARTFHFSGREAGPAVLTVGAARRAYAGDAELLAALVDAARPLSPPLAATVRRRVAEARQGPPRDAAGSRR